MAKNRHQKMPKSDFQSQSLMSKIIQIFLNFVLLKNIILGAHFLLFIFFRKLQFLNTFIF